MKILIVSNLFFPDHEGGAEKVARRAAEALSGAHDVTVLATGVKNSVDRLTDGYDVIRVPYRNLYPYHVGQSKEPAWRKLSWHVRNATGGVSRSDLELVLNERKPDVVYLHNAIAFLPQLADLCRDRRFPICVHLHDYALLCPKTSMYQDEKNCAKQCLKCLLFTMSVRRAMRATSHVIAVSDFVLDRHRAHGLCKAAKWHVLRNSEPDCEYIPLCRRPPIDNGPVIIGYIGALAPVKGLDCLVSAFLDLPVGCARLVIAGVGNDSFVEPLKARTAGREVRWLGHVDPKYFYDDIDCLVVPSRWHEPQCLVVVEAINRGIPLIASRRGGNTEMIEKYQAGILYEPDKPQELVDALKNIGQYLRPDWRKAIPKLYPGLNEGGSVTVKKTKYFERLESILVDCVAVNDVVSVHSVE